MQKDNEYYGVVKYAAIALVLDTDGRLYGVRLAALYHVKPAMAAILGTPSDLYLHPSCANQLPYIDVPISVINDIDLHNYVSNAIAVQDLTYLPIVTLNEQSCSGTLVPFAIFKTIADSNTLVHVDGLGRVFYYACAQLPTKSKYRSVESMNISPLSISAMVTDAMINISWGAKHFRDTDVLPLQSHKLEHSEGILVISNNVPAVEFTNPSIDYTKTFITCENTSIIFPNILFYLGIDGYTFTKLNNLVLPSTIYGDVSIKAQFLALEKPLVIKSTSTAYLDTVLDKCSTVDVQCAVLSGQLAGATSDASTQFENIKLHVESEINFGFYNMHIKDFELSFGSRVFKSPAPVCSLYFSNTILDNSNINVFGDIKLEYMRLVLEKIPVSDWNFLPNFEQLYISSHNNKVLNLCSSEWHKEVNIDFYDCNIISCDIKATLLQIKLVSDMEILDLYKCTTAVCKIAFDRYSDHYSSSASSQPQGTYIILPACEYCNIDASCVYATDIIIMPSTISKLTFLNKHCLSPDTCPRFFTVEQNVRLLQEQLSNAGISLDGMSTDIDSIMSEVAKVHSRYQEQK